MMTILHGSSKIIERPYFGGGSEYNDYGRGFYTVEEINEELAKEWACSPFNREKGDTAAFVNRYILNTKDLKIMNMDTLSTIEWIVLTAKNRNINVGEDLYTLEKKYLPDLSEYDCLYGWRCDDTYSSIVKHFFSGDYSIETVRDAMLLGYLQNQFVIVSEKAFNRIQYISSYSVSYDEYSEKFTKRKILADQGINECRIRHRNGKYIEDFLEDCK